MRMVYSTVALGVRLAYLYNHSNDNYLYEPGKKTKRS